MRHKGRTIKDFLKDIRLRAELFEDICNKAYEGIVIVDEKAHIVYMNESARQIVKLPIEEIIGKYVTDIIPYSRLAITLQTGTAETGWPQKVMGPKNLGRGNEGIVHRFPLKYNDRIIGAVGIVVFKDLKAVEEIIRKFKITMKMNKGANIFPRIGADFTFDNILGVSKSLNKLKEEATKVAQSNFNILLTGETGTGKELFAHALHNASTLASFPFVRINCAAIPSQLLESELFGYERGAFTGANSRKRGKFELAGTGSILLDEIAEMDVSLQSKLLRVLDEKRFERVGGTDVIPFNARIFSSSNQDLLERCRDRKLRVDLYHRIATIELNIPPLRERKDDIVFLAEHFRKKYEVSPFTERAIQVLLDYDWPGNIREMKNVFKRLSALQGDKKVIACGDLPKVIRFFKKQGQELAYLFTENQSHTSEINAIRDALVKTYGNKSKAARLLNISRATFYNKINQYHLCL